MMQNTNEKTKLEKTFILIIIVVGIIFGFLALLNGRYISTNFDGYMGVFDQWKGEYVNMKNHNR